MPISAPSGGPRVPAGSPCVLPLGLPSDALAYLLGKLRAYGSEVSPDHEKALAGLLWLATELTEGRLTGRVRFALPCGMGKTTGVRAFLRTVATLGLPHRLIVAASKVEQLCGLKRQLIAEDGVAPELIGLLHSYEVDPAKAKDGLPGFASEPSGGHDRQFLLVTHANTRVTDAGAPRAWLKGREDNLVFYDESLIVGDALTLPLLDEYGDSLRADYAAFETTLILRPEHEPAARWIKAAMDKLFQAARKAEKVDVVTVTIPSIAEAEAASYLRLRPMVCEKFPRLVSFIEQARDGVEFRVFIDRKSNRSLVSYSIGLPDTIRNVIVLDASDPVREIVHHDYRMTRAEDVVPLLAGFRDVPGGIASIKRYDNVTIYFAREGAGRKAMREEFAAGKRSALVQKFVRLMKQKTDRKTLAFVFKQKSDRDTNFARIVLGAARDAGIDPLEGVAEGQAAGRLNVLTWGRETATNDFQSCEVVALLGVFHPRSDVMAGQYLGQVDDLKAPGVAGLVTRLVRAEALHSVYQAINRGSMRRTLVIDGESQAAPCEVYIVHSDPDLRQKIEAVMPGAKWLPWREPDECLSESEIALLIEERLRELEAEGVKRVSLAALKPTVAPTVASTTWRRARNIALESIHWYMDGRSLVFGSPFDTAA